MPDQSRTVEITFEERIEYVVRFTTTRSLEDLESGEDAEDPTLELWFAEMGRQKPNWLQEAEELNIHMRHLIELKEVPAATEQAKEG